VDQHHQPETSPTEGYIGEAPTVITPVKALPGKQLLPCTKAYNRNHARQRAVGERGFATLKNWRILHPIRCTTGNTGTIAQAILALHLATCSTPKSRSSIEPSCCPPFVLAEVATLPE
jgi:hypothetical protein